MTASHPVRPALAAGPTSAPTSWLNRSVLLTVYGRGFGTDPTLGRLGADRTFSDLVRQVRPYVRAVHAVAPGLRVRVAIHLIYAMATPCSAAPRCLLYLDAAGGELTKRYIEPAARHGWLVVLDDQLGSSSPETELRRMIDRGYLAHDNVEVAFDPEFHSVAGQPLPGSPTGRVRAGDVNRAQALLARYARGQHLEHRKVLLLHQWTPDMIGERAALSDRYAYVDPVVVMDGIGAANDKVRTYQTLLDKSLPVRFRGIKIFASAATAGSAPIDRPALTWAQVLGKAPVFSAGSPPRRLSPAPSVIVMT